VAYVTKKEDSGIAPDTWMSVSDKEWRKFGAIAAAFVERGLGGLDGAWAKAGLGPERARTSLVEQEFGDSMQSVRDYLQELASALPTRTGCCIALIEHRRMSQTRDSLRKQGIVVMCSGPIRPRSLIMHGASLHAVEEVYAQG
jgi:hypothetical protein